jgi:redox-sensitive bicupin YhaK (pirin superfamily)
MSAGTGVAHSEFNHAKEKQTHFLQIWIRPSKIGVPPGYEQRSIHEQDKRGGFLKVASPAGAGGLVSMNADATIYAGLFDAGEQSEINLPPGRKAYAHLVRGELTINGSAMSAGDALMLSDEARLQVSHGRDAEVLVFDLAPT